MIIFMSFKLANIFPSKSKKIEDFYELQAIKNYTQPKYYGCQFGSNNWDAQLASVTCFQVSETRIRVTLTTI